LEKDSREWGRGVLREKVKLRNQRNIYFGELGGRKIEQKR
jgi:hypothetical protein